MGALDTPPAAGYFELRMRPAALADALRALQRGDRDAHAIRGLAELIEELERALRDGPWLVVPES